jgi:hypothetical protein
MGLWAEGTILRISFGSLSDHYAGAPGLVPPRLASSPSHLHKIGMAWPIFVPLQARVRLHSDQRIVALISEKTLCSAEDCW